MSAPPAELPRWIDIGLIPVINICLALLVSGLIILAIGENPVVAMAIMIRGALGYGEGCQLYNRSQHFWYQPTDTLASHNTFGGDKLRLMEK